MGKFNVGQPVKIKAGATNHIGQEINRFGIGEVGETRFQLTEDGPEFISVGYVDRTKSDETDVEFARETDIFSAY